MAEQLFKEINYLFLVGDGEIKIGDWYRTTDGVYCNYTGIERLVEGTKKVLAHKPKGIFPPLEGVDLIPQSK